MEPVAVLEMHKEPHDDHVIASHIVTDDDSSMKAKSKWSNLDTKINNNLHDFPHRIDAKTGKKVHQLDRGGAPAHMPEPLFLADPNHRAKSFGNGLCELAKMKVEFRKTMTQVDCVRPQTNCSHVMRGGLMDKSDEDKATAATTELEHHFDNHAHCGD